MSLRVAEGGRLKYIRYIERPNGDAAYLRSKWIHGKEDGLRKQRRGSMGLLHHRRFPKDLGGDRDGQTATNS